MKGWIYVLELAPAGRVKVGRTEALARRLAKHLASASFSGGAVTRVMSFAVDDTATAERELLASVAAHPRSVLVHGRETFAGITFMEAVGIADQVVGYRQGRVWADAGEDLRGRCASAMDAAGLTRVSLDHLRTLLGDDAPWTNVDLGRELRRMGVDTSTVHCPVRKRTMQGVKREWLVLRAAA